MTDWTELKWLNRPPVVDISGDTMSVSSGGNTDFWRGTFYGFWRDSGHFAYKTVTGDFSAEVTINGRYETLYDQAGLMARLSEAHWIKAGIELSDGKPCLSVVVTNDQSDWSMAQIGSASSVQLRLTRHAEALRVDYRHTSNERWNLVRLAFLPKSASLDVGVMCCSPERAGFEASFGKLKIGKPIERKLHD
jgi:regulation of enolase protein 1 (concanavalin A-like superfamily)